LYERLYAKLYNYYGWCFPLPHLGADDLAGLDDLHALGDAVEDEVLAVEPGPRQ
jgi:hypothetical protein